MKLVAICSWYDEDPDMLYKGVRSLEKAGVDHLVAVDGAFRLFPDGHPHSPDSNVQAILKACDEAGIEPHIHQPDTLWENNEIEKRTFLFRYAEQWCEPGVDWLLVWDADFKLGRCKNLKPRLAQTHLDAADLRVIEPPDPDKPAPYRPGTLIPMPIELDVRLMYRATPGIHCFDNHYTYKTPDGRFYWGNHVTDPLVEGLPLYDVQVLHRCANDSRRARQIRYYQERKEQRAEDTMCKYCRQTGSVRDIAVGWKWAQKGSGGWHLSSALVPACGDCAVKHGTPRDKPLTLECPECHAESPARFSCQYCNRTGRYTIARPGDVFDSGRPVTAVAA